MFDFIYSLPLLTIHITSVFITLALVVVSDAHGALWLLGKMKTLPEKRMEFLHKATWIGLCSTALAGLLMASAAFEYYLSLPAFQLKMLFVFMLGVNAFVIGSHVTLASTHTFKELPRKEKIILLASALVSTSGWIGAYTCAQFLY